MAQPITQARVATVIAAQALATALMVATVRATVAISAAARPQAPAGLPTEAAAALERPWSVDIAARAVRPLGGHIHQAAQAVGASMAGQALVTAVAQASKPAAVLAVVTLTVLGRA